MSESYYLQFLALHKEAQRAMATALNELGQAIAGDVLRLSLPKGRQSDFATDTIDPANEGAILKAAQARVQTFFLGESKTPVLEGEGHAAPNAPYVSILWPYLIRAAQIAKARQRAIITRQFEPYPDVWTVFQPFYDKATSVIVQEIDKTFDARLMEIAIGDVTVMEALPPERPVATYDPVHRWVKPDGYRLSDRIWITDEETRRRLDLYITTKIREGVSSTDLANGVIQFLNPGQYLPETNKPYGRDVSYNAMRLARTEISAAYAQADIAAARANPLVVSYDVYRTRYGKPCPICDPVADGSPYDILDESAVPPEHPNCLCSLRFNYQESIADTVERLRAELRDKHPDLFDANGMMGLADKVRVNTSKWIPGQLTSPDPQLVRSTLSEVNAPLKQTLEKTFAGTFEGDLYIEVHEGVAQRYLDGDIPRPAMQVGSEGWYKGGEGLRTTYELPSDKRRVLRYTTDGLKVGSRETFEELVQQASEKATALWGDTPLTHLNQKQFELLVKEQFESLARQSGYDAFMWKNDNLLITSWEKVRYAQTYSADDLIALSRPGANKPLLEAMQAATERYAPLLEQMETISSDLHPLLAERDVLTAQRVALNEQVNAAREAWLDMQEINPNSPLTQQLKDAYFALDDQAWQLQIAWGENAEQIIQFNLDHKQAIYDILPKGSAVDLTPEWQAGYTRGKNKAKWQQAFDWVSETVNGDIYDDTYAVTVNKISGRAYQSKGGIYLSTNNDIATAIHELGHALEEMDSYTHERCVEFLQYRTDAANVKWLGGSYRTNEIADPDDFFNRYIGKIYGSWDDPYATEVLSMGLEYLYRDPFKFYQDDPEMFEFIIGLIAGWI